MEEEREEGGGEGREGGRREQPIASHGTDSLRCQGNARQQIPTLGDVFKSQEREGEKVILPFECPSPMTPQYLKGVRNHSHGNPFVIGAHPLKGPLQKFVLPKKVSGRLQ